MARLGQNCCSLDLARTVVSHTPSRLTARKPCRTNLVLGFVRVTEQPLPAIGNGNGNLNAVQGHREPHETRTTPHHPPSPHRRDVTTLAEVYLQTSSHTRTYTHTQRHTLDMSGKGGKETAKRHRQVTQDSIKGVTKPAIRRLARRAGVKRISGSVYDEIRKDHKDRGPLQHFLRTIMHDAVTLTEHARAKTVTSNAVVRSLRRNKKPIAGYGGDSPPATPGRKKRKKPASESQEEPEEEKDNGNNETKQEEKQTESHPPPTPTTSIQQP